jgi:pyridoxamine 5'-phosphate oxidase
MDLEQLRRQYSGRPLLESDIHPDPFEQFRLWFHEAVETSQIDWMEPHAMTLATSDETGRPSCRTVLLKGFDKAGFVFFSNYVSEKGTHLSRRPDAALLFYWPQLARQIRIEGTCSKTDRRSSEDYFHSRPRGSQISAAISDQSSVVESRSELERRARELESFLNGGEVPVPDEWGGYCLNPVYFEFWQGREDRLHDRLCYERSGDVWSRFRLAP